jgi:hypothetical protein
VNGSGQMQVKGMGMKRDGMAKLGVVHGRLGLRLGLGLCLCLCLCLCLLRRSMMHVPDGCRRLEAGIWDVAEKDQWTIK